MRKKQEKPERPRVWWVHYNKPESVKQKRNVLTVHYKGVCHLVNHVYWSNVEMCTKHRKSQPRCVLWGTGFVTFKTTSKGVRARISGTPVRSRKVVS